LQQHCSTLQQKNTTLQQKIDELQPTIHNEIEQLKECEATRRALEQTCATLEGKNATLRENFEEMRGKFEAAVTREEESERLGFKFSNVSSNVMSLAYTRMSHVFCVYVYE
jgi:predicted nuclease with TOPRIM domain